MHMPDENMNNEALSEEKKPASEYGESGIDFSGVDALANSDFVPEPWYTSLGFGILNFLIKIGLFLLGFLLDILKTLWTIISGVFVYTYKAALGLGRFIRKEARIFKEVDIHGKLTFLIQGWGNLKYGQAVDGIVFFLVEVLFVVFMVTMGGTNIANLFALDAVARKSHQRLLLGIIAILVCIAYIVVYIKGINAMYDDYQILHELEFRAAHEDAVDVVKNFDRFDVDLTKMSHGKVFKYMRYEKGYSYLSARYISYVDFKRIPEKRNPFFELEDKITHAIYRKYLGWRDRVKAGKWADVFADYLNWKLVKRVKTTGYDYILDKAEGDLVRFRHTFDKYNDYHAVVRDSENYLRCFADPELLLAACYAEDKVSESNGLQPISHRQAPKAKELVSRIIGAFEVSFPVGRRVSKFAASILAKKCGDDRACLMDFGQEYEREKAFHDGFIDTFRTGAINEAKALEEAYKDYANLRSVLDGGKKAFLSELDKRGIHGYRAKALYVDYAYAAKLGDEEAAIAWLEQAGERFANLGSIINTYAFHGQTLTFKREAKQFLDERFATTVLALPTIGALLTCVLPLVFSIAIGFTNWDGSHTAYRFNWNMDAWGQVFGMGGGSFVTTFLTLLRWTIIWAIFSTFTNYIFGIILALLINKKGIKFKGFWRTMFVITIAIPQFITLLVVSLLFASDGPINEYFATTFGWKIPFLSQITNGTPAFELDSNFVFIKMMIIIFNMWVGIPYTMLSTSGILMNIPADLYESAQIDGASPWTQFWKITMPYILFVTGPSLLTTFIGNINNFNVIYFLSGGGPTLLDELGQMNAGHTDLLITWLFKITANKPEPEYAMGSVIGILMFVICAFFSLIMYKRTGSVKNEEEFQ